MPAIDSTRSKPTAEPARPARTESRTSSPCRTGALGSSTGRSRAHSGATLFPNNVATNPCVTIVLWPAGAVSSLCFPFLTLLMLEELPPHRLRRSSFRCSLLFLTPSQANRGEALQQAESTLFQMIFLRQFSAHRPERILSWKRKIFNARKP
jgi:hypothetical protein